MKKIIAYFLVQLVTKNPDKSVEIVESLLGSSKNVIHSQIKKVTNQQKIKETNISKKDELESSLNYLKLKKNKTKQDKDSIYTLEMVLKNMI